MKVSATAVTDVPETVVAREVERTGEMRSPMGVIDAHIALLVILVPSEAVDSSEPAVVTPAKPALIVPKQPAPEQLPAAGSSLPLVGLLGGLFCFIAVALKVKRALTAKS